LPRFLAGGARLIVGGAEQPLGPFAEYPARYARLGERVRGRGIAADYAPLRIPAGAALIGRRDPAQGFPAA
jgi:hypothetical protein